MGKEIDNIDNIEIEKENTFYRHKTPTLLGDVDIEKSVSI